MTILFHQGALGDWALTLPLLRALPPPLVLVAPWSRSALAARLLEMVEPFDIERPECSRLYTSQSPLDRDGPLAAHLRRAHLVISFVSSPGDPWGFNVQGLAPKARLLFVHPRPPADWPGHVCDWHLHQLQAQGLEVAQCPVAIRTNPRGPIVVHPGSGGQAKCWGLERFEALIELLRNAGRSVQVILGEVEHTTWDSGILAHWQDDLGARVVWMLDELCTALEAAGRFVGNDSGPTHLSAQLGIPTLALFGPTNPAIWAPRGPRVQVLAPPEPGPIAWLSVQTVVESDLLGR